MIEIDLKKIMIEIGSQLLYLMWFYQNYILRN